MKRSRSQRRIAELATGEGELSARDKSSTPEDCPYGDGDGRRIYWEAGWYAERERLREEGERMRDGRRMTDAERWLRENGMVEDDDDLED